MRINYLLLTGLLGLSIVLPSFAEEPVNLSVMKSPAVNKVVTHAVVTDHGAIEKTAKPVNINNADAQTITQSLKGIGKKRAEAIVAYRGQNGAFKSIDDLTKVKGITKKVIEKNSGKILLN